MKKISMVKKIMLILLALVLVLTGVSVITDTPPFVVIKDKHHFVFSSRLELSDSLRSEVYYSNEDVKALEHMRWVKKLEMTVTHITDMSFLNKMKHLKEMYYVAYTGFWVEDWTPLNNCKKLEFFCGMRLNMSDLSVFKELTNLKKLYIEHERSGAPVVIDTKTKINDISDLQYLVNLENFYIQGENITDISSLAHCKKVKRLSLNGVTATDGSVLLELPNLESLEIDKGVLKESEIKALEEKGVSVYEYSKDE